MGVAILVCGCGLKVRAAGATPGAWGDAPSAAASCEFLKTHRKSSRSDQEPPIPLARNRAMVSNHQGKSPRKKTGRAQPSDVTPPRTGYVERKTELPMAGGILPPLQKTEASWFASILYPLRSADSLAVIATLTAILWLFTILVPEYCLGLMGDADQMGTPTIGKLIALISILPVAFLLPFAVFYWIQYLGRVVVASAMGETIPPARPIGTSTASLAGSARGSPGCSSASASAFSRQCFVVSYSARKTPAPICSLSASPAWACRTSWQPC